MHTTSLPTDEFGGYKCIKEQHSISPLLIMLPSYDHIPKGCLRLHEAQLYKETNWTLYQSIEGRNGQVTLQLGINQHLVITDRINYWELQFRGDGKMHSGVYSTARKAVTSALKISFNLSSNDLHYGFTCNCTLFKGIYVYSYSCSSSITLDIAT